MPNWFLTVTVAGSFCDFGAIPQQTRRALAFVIVLLAPVARTVCCTGLHCICTLPTAALNPPSAKRFFRSAACGAALNDVRIAELVVAAAV